jgi:predicted nucleic acid-binding protein
VEKYHNLPMDYADATLVALAEESETDHVFRLDRKGFSTYRLHGRKAFRLVP